MKSTTERGQAAASVECVKKVASSNTGKASQERRATGGDKDKLKQ